MDQNSIRNLDDMDPGSECEIVWGGTVYRGWYRGMYVETFRGAFGPKARENMLMLDRYESDHTSMIPVSMIKAIRRKKTANTRKG